MDDQNRKENLPVTISELQQNAHCWSLAADAGMLQYVQDYSQKLMARTHTLQQQMNSLCYDVDLTNVKVQNTVNDFIHLSNTQFIENRVYEEDVSAEKPANSKDEPPKTKEQLEAELIPKFTNAVTLCLGVIDRAFEKVEVRADDSDGEDTAANTNTRRNQVMVVRDPYIQRSLPFIIGTPAFFQDDTVGLVDKIPEPEKEERNIEAEESAQISGGQTGVKNSRQLESDDDDSSSVETAPPPAAALSRPPQKKDSRFMDNSDTEDSEGDLFGTTSRSGRQESAAGNGELSSDEEQAEERVAPPPAGNDFLSELSKKLNRDTADTRPVASAADKPRPETKSVTEAKKPAKDTQKPAGAGLFGTATDGAANDEDDEDDLFSFATKKGKTGGGLFTATRGGLFDDDEDVVAKPAASSVTAKKEAGELPKPDVTAAAKPVQASPVATKPAVTDSKPTPPPATQPVKAPAKPAAGGGLFGGDDDDDDDLFAVARKPSTSNKVVEPAPLPAAVSPASTTAQKPAVIKPQPIGNLFDDEADADDDDLFSIKPKQSSAPAAKTQVNTPQAKTSDTTKAADTRVADVEQSDTGEDEALTPKKKLPAGAVSLFGSAGITAALNARHTGRVTLEESGDSWSSDSVRDDSVTASVKSPPAAAKKDEQLAPAKPKVTPPLLADDDDGLFSAPAPKPAKPVETKPTTAASKTGRGLFGADDDDDDLFAPLSSKSKAQPQVKEPVKSQPPPATVNKPPATNIVTQPAAANPTTTIASATPPKPAAVAQSATVAKSKSALFDDDDDDDLFSVPKKTPAGASVSKPVTNAPTNTQPSVSPAAPSKQPITQPAANNTSSSRVADTKASVNVKAKGLFDNDDEDDDLFSVSKSGTSSSKTQTTAPSQPSAQAETVAKSSPATEPVNTVTTPAEVSVVSSSVISSSSSTMSTAANSGSKTQPGVVGSKVAPVSASAAGRMVTSNSDEDEDDDDLFSLIKKVDTKKQLPPPTPVGNKTKPVSEVITAPTAAAAEQKVDTRAVKGVDDTSTATTSAKSTVLPVGAPKPWRPAGAVSMFGGVDPSALVKKTSAAAAAATETDPLASASRHADDHNDATTAAAVTEPASPLSHKVPPPVAKKRAPSPTPNTDPLSPADATTTTTAPTPSTSASAAPTVGKLKVSLAINPAALLPGAAPPSSQPDSVAASFDTKPVVSNALQSVTKDRVALRGSRRPPSRKTHVAAEGAVAPDDTLFSTPTPAVVQTSTSSVVSQTQAEVNNSTSNTKPAAPKPSSKPTVAAHSNMDVPDSGASSVTTSANSDANSDDIFSSKPREPVAATVKPKLFLPEDDILGSGLFSKPNTPSATTGQLASQSAAVKSGDTVTDASKSLSKSADDDTDDIFASKKPVGKKVPASANDVDDIFTTSAGKRAQSDDLFSPKSTSAKKEVDSSATLVAKTTETNNASSKANSLSKSTEQTSEQSTPDSKVSSTKNTSSTKPSSKIALLDDDDDDIFASSKYVGKSAQVAKVNATSTTSATVESKVSETSGAPSHTKTDKFEDIFATTSKTTARKEQTPTADIFAVNTSAGSRSLKRDDDFDKISKDIFGDDNSLKRSTKPAATAADDTDIFSSSKPLQPAKTKTPVSTAATTDDTEDIFASSAKTSKAKKAPKVTDDDIFKDSGDIFASSTTARSKSKATDSSKAPSNSNDDIFASVPKSKSKTKQASSASPTDIFDDPLNALSNN